MDAPVSESAEVEAEAEEERESSLPPGPRRSLPESAVRCSEPSARRLSGYDTLPFLASRAL